MVLKSNPLSISSSLIIDSFPTQDSSSRGAPSASASDFRINEDAGMDVDVDPPEPDHSVRTESDDVPWLRLFMILVLWLSCARGLSRACANVILVFVRELQLPAHNITSPRHIATVRKQLGHKNSMVKYVVCPKDACQACWIVSLAPPICNLCRTSLFHPDRNDRPISYFHYGSVIRFLQECFEDNGFEDLVNHWRDRSHRSTLADIYDGTAWDADGFMHNRLHLRLTLGVDWFTPHSFSNTASYTIGAVSLRIENLPPSMRNRPEYMHVAAVLPGPRQTGEAGLNAALKPLIDELRQLSEGVHIHTPGYPLTRTLRAKLLMALGDTPARAKLAGFPSHSQSGRWCGHCLADSASWVDELVREEVPALRIPDSHRTAAFLVKANAGAREDTLRSSAATWTALYDLPYWRSVTDVPVDAMHALHLGACKRFWHATLVDGHLLPSQFPIIGEVISSASYPRNLTAIRPNFGTKSGGSPTSDAWSTFARFLLPLVLASHWSEELAIDGSQVFSIQHKSFRPAGLSVGAPTPMFHCTVLVRHLVTMAADLSLMTHIVQQTEFTEARLSELDRVIKDHISSIADHIDPRWPMPNHHALTHLPDHIRRFGPPREFWFYSMERLNGFLKKSSSHDPFQRDTDDLGYSSNVATVCGKGDPIILEAEIFQGIVTMINDTRGSADPLAVPDAPVHSRYQRPEGPNGGEALRISYMATSFPSITLRSGTISPARSRANVAKGASNVIVNTNEGHRPGELLAVFDHTHSNPRLGQLVKRTYAEVIVYRLVDWPEQHPLAPRATRLGYFLFSTDTPERRVVPIANIVDTYVGATAKHIVGNDAARFAARLHP
ncbi:unnamed protein product [Tilletia laevis]|nr:unnamed protein product [Tilletia laevis]